MPDWSYHTLFKPLLFRLPAKLSRDITLGLMGTLSRLPLGTLVIRTLGHMEAHPMLKSQLAGTDVTLPYPIGLSGDVDPAAVAQEALSQFGFGYLEVGPVTIEPLGGAKSEKGMARDLSREAIVYPRASRTVSMAQATERLRHQRKRALPRMLRIQAMPGCSPKEAEQQLCELIRGLEEGAAAFHIDILNEGWPLQDKLELLRNVLRNCKDRGRAVPLFVYLPLSFPVDDLPALRDGLPWNDGHSENLTNEQYAGFVIGDAWHTEQGERYTGANALQPCLERVQAIRKLWAAAMPVIAGGGVHSPDDALKLMEAGASAIQLHSGLVYAGPGLPKRINEAIIYEKIRDDMPPAAPSFWHGWGWMWRLGLGMLIGGIIAWIIAATLVVLPYDVAFLGMTLAELEQMNRLIPPFMSHDRITLAGTMMSIGILYMFLSYYGLRQGQHWAKTALVVSCSVGLCSFFLFLGYGYFDPLHAAVAVVLLLFFLLSLRARGGLPSYEPVNTANDRIWLRAQWGQCMMVILGFALAIGGAVIAVVGVTDVFVATDLAYLCASPEQLAAISDRLLPLIAHDRAGFGGALFSNALALLAASLWGIGEGRRWLWFALLLGGLPGFIAGFSVHLWIGYTTFVHLLPAYFAFSLYVLGLIWLYPYMMRKPVRTRASL
ncbi:hypothetical protein DUZ99_15770 [Xylanibacillus composti]|uniref:Dihydroorotate dehydrogenase B (NAD(+)), catalytic subunit n=1 Tax=Xylanibacillus composti TaxID=1572762 RepID=A0A8J4H8S2_9BACL|nr:hypothetical protein [Xylanibacillus composti]MDT9726441.1 hypothetical protein [Xylanibacillus composti]GIQ71108.1 hypothetical protein XYCOK13_39320 [Xylanibacillus composti]